MGITRSKLHYAGTWTTSDGSSNGDIVNYSSTDEELMQFISSGHRFRNGKPLEGGDFLLVKETIQRGASPDIWVTNNGYDPIYHGKVFRDTVPPSIAPSGWATSGPTHRTNLLKRGSEAFNKLRPDAPDFSLGEQLGELRELPGMLKDGVKSIIDRSWVKNSDRALGNAARYNLAVQFGWVPLVGSIRDFVQTHKNLQKRLTQLIRDAERPVRRRVTLKDDAAGQNYTNYGQFQDRAYTYWNAPWFVTTALSGYPQIRWRHRYESKTWAEGRFRYVLPPGPRDVEYSKKLARRLFGFRPTPEMVYNLMPWSWLADYFTGLGQFMTAISPGVADRCIAEYAYLMRSIEWQNADECTRGYAGRRISGKWNQVDVTTSAIRTATIKLRVGASLFGWGLKSSDLTPTQIGILASLTGSKLN